jgi:programmed cell death protein 5
MEDDENNSPSSTSDKQRSAEEARQAKAAKEQMLRMVFTSEARERLSNVRMVKPEQADLIENQIFQLVSSGKLRRQINDEELKTLLGQLQKPKREFRINYK